MDEDADKRYPDLAYLDGELVRGRWLAPGKFLRKLEGTERDDAREKREAAQEQRCGGRGRDGR